MDIDIGIDVDIDKNVVYVDRDTPRIVSTFLNMLYKYIFLQKCLLRKKGEPEAHRFNGKTMRSLTCDFALGKKRARTARTIKQRNTKQPAIKIV